MDIVSAVLDVCFCPVLKSHTVLAKNNCTDLHKTAFLASLHPFSSFSFLFMKRKKGKKKKTRAEPPPGKGTSSHKGLISKICLSAHTYEKCSKKKQAVPICDASING